LTEKYIVNTQKNKLLIKNTKLLCPTHPTEYLLVKIPDFGHFISRDGMSFIFFVQ